MFDNASLDIKSYNVSEVVRASAHDKGGKSFISIDTTGTVNVEFGCDELERTYPRVFCGYSQSKVKVMLHRTRKALHNCLVSEEYVL